MSCGTGKLRRIVGPGGNCPGRCSFRVRPVEGRPGKRRVGDSRGVAVPAGPLWPERGRFRSTPP